jgi:hypothetical protein
MTGANAMRAQAYRGLAEKCREMAARTRRSGPLLARAEAFDKIAAAIERGQGPTGDVL